MDFTLSIITVRVPRATAAALQEADGVAAEEEDFRIAGVSVCEALQTSKHILTSKVVQGKISYCVLQGDDRIRHPRFMIEVVLRGEILELEVYPEMTVSEMESMLELGLGIPTRMQRLVFKAETLSSCATVGEVGIVAGDQIFLHPKIATS